jgi:hypothetical protein
MDEKQISDMYLAAAILSYGGVLVGIDRKDARKQKFRFSGEGIPEIYVVDNGNMIRIVSPTLEIVETKFVSQSLYFPPTYPDALRRIKSAIHAE